MIIGIFSVTEKTSIAAEKIFIRLFTDIPFHGIHVYIPYYIQEIIRRLHGFCTITPLKQMPDAIVFPVIPIHKSSGDSLKEISQRFGAFFDQEVNMVRHQAPGIDHTIAIFPLLAEDLYVSFVVFCVEEYGLPIIAAQYCMIDVGGALSSGSLGMMVGFLLLLAV